MKIEEKITDFETPMTYIERNSIYYQVPVWVKEKLEVLEKYKKNEEELGIDFITLYKVLLAEIIYFKKHIGDGKFKITEIHPRGLKINQYTKEPSIIDGEGNLHLLIGYGKTWALHREELNHEGNNKN